MSIILLNGNTVEIESPDEILSHVFSNCGNLKFWSEDALEVLFIGMIELALEYCGHCLAQKDVEDKSKYTGFIRAAKRKLFYFHKEKKSKAKILGWIYDSILQSEDLCTLRGFRFANSYGDAEKQSYLVVAK